MLEFIFAVYLVTEFPKLALVLGYIGVGCGIMAILDSHYPGKLFTWNVFVAGILFWPIIACYYALYSVVLIVSGFYKLMVTLS